MSLSFKKFTKLIVKSEVAEMQAFDALWASGKISSLVVIMGVLGSFGAVGDAPTLRYFYKHGGKRYLATMNLAKHNADPPLDAGLKYDYHHASGRTYHCKHIVNGVWVFKVK